MNLIIFYSLNILHRFSDSYNIHNLWGISCGKGFSRRMHYFRLQHVFHTHSTVIANMAVNIAFLEHAIHNYHKMYPRIIMTNLLVLFEFALDANSCDTEHSMVICSYLKIHVLCFIMIWNMHGTEESREWVVEGGSEKVKIGILKNKRNSKKKFFCYIFMGRACYTYFKVKLNKRL